MERTREAAQVAAVLGLSADSIGRYAREGRVPFNTTPGGHRRYNIDEVRQALALAGSDAGGRLFSTSAATLRRRRIRSVHTPVLAHEAQPAREARLRSIEQGDLIGFGAIGIAVRAGSALAVRAGLTDATPGDVVSLSIETASGWYAVLTQDCDVVRRVEDEPCLTVAPVLYVPKATWDALSSGLSSYRMFPLPPAGVDPVDEAHTARIPAGHLPVVDIRYVGSVDKTALLEVPQRHVLVGKLKLRFQEWVGQRFGRESFADAVHERVLPAARQTLVDTLAQAATKPDSDTKVLASVSEWYVRCTDRYVEVMGRLDPDRARATGTLKKADGEATYNAPLLDAGCRRLTKRATTTLRGGGYTIRFTVADFDELSASEFETWTHWVVADEPPAVPAEAVGA